MIYLDLFLGFLKVGCFAFGGAYGAIPLIRDVVLSYGWMSEDALTYMIAVSESTPGPIMVNLATFVGSTKGGVPGALLATLAVLLPSFLVVLLIAASWKKLLKNRWVQAALRGLKPCIIGIVLSTGLHMVCKGALPVFGSAFDAKALVITLLLAGILYGSKPLTGKKLSPILLIVIAAALGAGAYSL